MPDQVISLYCYRISRPGQMRRKGIIYSSIWVGLGLLNMRCQPTTNSESTGSQAEAPQPAVATLSKPTYAVGDSVAIHLGQSLSGVTVLWDGTSLPVRQPVGDSVTLSAAGKTVGLHRLIVRGMLSLAHSVTDTLTVELRSDVIPVERPFTVLATYPHQTTSFTQGLEFNQGSLYESTGLNGQSRLMRVNATTGLPLQTVTLPTQHFGEGITVVNGHIYQLTWTSGLCFRYNMNFKLEKTFTYHTQGWGLTHRDSTLILSDGTNKLYFYTPDFQRVGELSVYDNRGPVVNINELEYVNGYVFANTWQTNRIIQIDLKTGKVVASLNLQSLADRTAINTQENVLNGIAYQPREHAFYVTGKNWPLLFKLKLALTRSVL